MKKILLTLVIGTLIFSSCKRGTDKSEQINYKIITSDLDNFWSAYDAIANSKDNVQTFQQLYIDKASPEFIKFLELRKHFTAKHYVDWIKNAPKFWKSIRPLTIAVKEKKAVIEKVYLKMGELYPEFQAPDICFAISPLGSGGTTDNGLILIGTEIATVNPKLVDISEINGFLSKIFKKSTGNIKFLVAHELVHTQQPEGDNVKNRSLLAQAISEGAADFIADLILGEPSMNKAILEYGEENQKELWAEFKSDVEAKKEFMDTDWFYKYNSDRPGDLGYYIGYKISQSYYNNSPDKTQAVKEIIEMDNAEEFLIKSKYGE